MVFSTKEESEYEKGRLDIELTGRQMKKVLTECLTYHGGLSRTRKEEAEPCSSGDNVEGYWKC